MLYKILLFEFVLFISTVLAEKEFQVSAFDAAMKSGGIRARSMGGVFVAIDQGLESLMGNPAGLTSIAKRNFLFSTSVRPYWRAIQVVIEPADSYEFDKYLSIHQMGIGGTLFQKNAIGPIHFGIGYRVYYDWSRASASTGDMILKTKITGFIRGVCFGLAKQLSERLVVGSNFHFPTRSLYKYDRYYIFSPHDSHESLKKLNLHTKPFFQLGCIYRLSTKFDLGLNYISPHQFIVEKTITYKMPGTLDVGLAWKCSGAMLLATDIVYRPWEQYLIADLPISNVKNGYAFRTGLEYGKRMLFRTGFALDCLPLLNEDDQSVYQKSVTVGLGFTSDNCRFSLGSAFKFFNSTIYWGYPSLRMREVDVFAAMELFN